MRFLVALACAVLIAGAEAAQDVSVNAGDAFTFNVFAFGSTVTSCHLARPDGTVLDFVHGEPSTHGDRYKLAAFDESIPGCSIEVRNIAESEEGLWTLSYNGVDGSSAAFQVTVVPGEVVPEENIDGGIVWLKPIDHPTRTEQVIDVTLSKLADDEQCYVKSPNGDVIEGDDTPGVTMYGSSNFVSCRVRIGPMNENLLGDWTLCGKRTHENEEIQRCQLARITWNNDLRPETIWGTISQRQYDHPVHYGGTLTPVVIGTGSVVTCHVVTPDGEDIVVTHDSEYPNLKRIDVSDDWFCSVAIGPIDASLIGDWVLYGKFVNPIQGLNEVRLPIHMFLYDEENPYNQAYNVSVMDPINYTGRLGSTARHSLGIAAGAVEDCQFVTPAGETYDLTTQHNFEGASFVDGYDYDVACRLEIGPLTESLIGKWQITAKFSTNNEIFTELQQIFNVYEEDPENPVEEDRIIEYLDEHYLHSAIGESHELVIYSDLFIEAESCHLRTPSGLQYKLMEGFDVNGVEVIESSGVECGVKVNVLSEEAVGNWTLIARATRFTEEIERRLPFTIYVEETVEAEPNDVHVDEGGDVYIRLVEPALYYGTCLLVGPATATASHKVDPSQEEEFCAFIIENVHENDAGTWEIIYGNTIVYRASVLVTVTATTVTTEVSATETSVIDLLLDREVSQEVGPENVVYCKLVDPEGFTMFEGFSRCQLSLEKVNSAHHGLWKMLVGYSGRILLEEQSLWINALESEGKPVVTTSVVKENPVVTVSCSVAVDSPVRACKFRNPHGKILLASGASEDRYVSSSQTSSGSYQCSIQITNPLVSDLGLWRCAIDTDDDTYYGFLDVLCPWALSDPAIAATVEQEPVLKAERTMVTAVEGDAVVMSCSAAAALRYCYFRAQNGTIFSVSPGMQGSNMEYFGAGLDAGECGVRFAGMAAADSGRWSCHAGLVRSAEEQREQLQLVVHDLMRVSHYYAHGGNMVVEGIVHENRALDYCRFVRIDGFGFTDSNVPAEYTLSGIVANGECQLTARNPTILDIHPWTIAARVRGQDVEISKDTMEAVLIAGPEEHEEPAPGEEPHGGGGIPEKCKIFMYCFLSIALTATVMGVWLGPKRHRQWTADRASALRRSLQGLGRKKEMPPAYDPEVQTP